MTLCTIHFSGHRSSGTPQILPILKLCRRYASKVKGLRAIFSEYGLIRFRVAVEARWLQKLSQIPEIAEVPAFSQETNQLLDELATRFSVEDAQGVKKVNPTSDHAILPGKNDTPLNFESCIVLDHFCTFLTLSWRSCSTDMAGCCLLSVVFSCYLFDIPLSFSMTKSWLPFIHRSLLSSHLRAKVLFRAGGKGDKPWCEGHRICAERQVPGFSWTAQG